MDDDGAWLQADIHLYVRVIFLFTGGFLGPHVLSDVVLIPGKWRRPPGFFAVPAHVRTRGTRAASGLFLCRERRDELHLPRLQDSQGQRHNHQIGYLHRRLGVLSASVSESWTPAMMALEPNRMGCPSGQSENSEARWDGC